MKRYAGQAQTNGGHPFSNAAVSKIDPLVRTEAWPQSMISTVSSARTLCSALSNFSALMMFS